MMTPVGHRSMQSAHRVQTSSSTTKNTWSFGSSPGWSAFTASSIASLESMWMHFQGQMSTQPSQRMHSAWSMCRNCFGFTAWVSHFGSTSCRTYEVENSGIGGFASLRAMSGRLRRDGAPVGRHALVAATAQATQRSAARLFSAALGVGDLRGGSFERRTFLPSDEQPHLQREDDAVDDGAADVDDRRAGDVEVDDAVLMHHER